MGTQRIKPLSKALDMDPIHAPHEMLRYFISSVLHLWGLPEWVATPEDVRPRIAEAIDVYARLVNESAPFEDLLGTLYMDMASRSKSRDLGQYFTPWAIALMMAALNAGNNPLAVRKEGLIDVSDLSCGSGVMLLAFANHVVNCCGESALLRLSLHACDIDDYCARITALQLVANCNVHGFRLGEIRVVQGNSLTNNNLRLILHATAPELMVADVVRSACSSYPKPGRKDTKQLDLFTA